MDQQPSYAGIDVAKSQIDVAVRPTGDRCEVTNDAAGIQQLVCWLKTLEPVMVF